MNAVQMNIRLDPRVAWVTVTPDMAKEWLQLNVPNNRNIKRHHVSTMAREMAAGRWWPNGSAIVFDDQGALRDGQHRLTAVINAGMPIRTLVVRGVQSEAFGSIDQGKKRTGADVLTIAGESNAAAISGALQILWRQENGYGLFQGAMSPSAQETHDLLLGHPEIRGGIRSALSVAKLIPPSIAIWLWVNLHNSDPALCAQFFEAIKSGEGLKQGMPEYRLREALVANAASRKKMTREYLAAVCIKAWNAMRQGKALHLLRWAPNEPFPEVA